MLATLNMELAPAFKKLKNPVLRRTVDRAATLQQAAVLGNVPVTEIINTLRSEIGQELYEDDEIYNKINYEENPMQTIFDQLELVKLDRIFRLITPFVPAPVIELIAKKGYAHYCIQKQSILYNKYFYYSSDLSL